jgi:nitroimidazol reductase NimA-like FMN-containing flavoprotein (pyridoxamine 5'-phosphate oxidase superfamily)
MYIERADLRMDDDAIAGFLTQHSWGRLGSVSGGGEPHVAPIGYVYVDGRIYFLGLRRSRRARDLAHERRVALCVDDGVGADDAYADRRGVVVYAEARVLDPDDPALAAVGPAFAERFFGDREAGVRRPTHDWYELTPYRFASWDFAKIPAGADRMVPAEGGEGPDT